MTHARGYLHQTSQASIFFFFSILHDYDLAIGKHSKSEYPSYTHSPTILHHYNSLCRQRNCRVESWQSTNDDRILLVVSSWRCICIILLTHDCAEVCLKIFLPVYHACGCVRFVSTSVCSECSCESRSLFSAGVQKHHPFIPCTGEAQICVR